MLHRGLWGMVISSSAVGAAKPSDGTGETMAKNNRMIHVLQAGRFTASVEEFLAMLDFHLNNTLFMVLVVTEVSPGKYRKPAKAWAKRNKVHIYHPKGAGADECMIVSRQRIHFRRAVRVTKLRLKFGRTAPTFLILGRIFGWGTFGILHTPAHTGGLREDGKYAWPTKVYRSVREGIHIALMKIRKMTLSMDANLDMRLDKNRELWEATLPGLTIAAPKDQHPTEGGRVIDVSMTNLLILTPSKTLRTLRGFDHRAVATELGRPA